jgi:predicted branched-subunit amino acid permease
LSDDSPRARFAAGFRAQAPALVGVLPFGLAVGVASAAGGLTFWEGLVLSVLSFSGLVQLITVQLHASGVPFAIIVGTCAVVSLRLLMYSASVAPQLGRISWPEKLGVAYVLTDHAYALAAVEFTRHPGRAHKHWFIIGTGVPTCLLWNVSVALGLAAGAQLPAAWSLDFTVTLTFLALLVPLLRDRASIVAAVVGGVAAVAAYSMPMRLGLVTAGMLGLAAGAAWHAWERR